MVVNNTGGHSTAVHVQKQPSPLVPSALYSQASPCHSLLDTLRLSKCAKCLLAWMPCWMIQPTGSCPSLAKAQGRRDRALVGSDAAQRQAHAQQQQHLPTQGGAL